MARLVHRLHLDGEWDGALALLDGAGSDGKGGGHTGPDGPSGRQRTQPT
ncbi:MAG: hypothetical protein ACRDNF_17730 [Streptosporangiaceae bacterium]